MGEKFDFVFGLRPWTKLSNKLHFLLINSQNFSNNCSVRREASRACGREASHAHGGKKPKNSIPKGAGGGTPNFFSPQI